MAQQVSDNDIECAVPYAGKEFDLVAMYDVLEHLENEISSLKNIHKALRKNGILMITVPAYMFLWSKHDEMVHHKRRYTREDLVRLVASQGYQVERSSYFNTWLFPPIALVRLIRRMCKSDVHHQEDKLANPADWINRILYRVFASEKYLLKLSNLPFGVSILLVARKA